MIKGILALLLFTGAQSFAAERFSPEISPDTGRPSLSLKMNRADGSVYVHAGGQWKRARHFEESMHKNSVEALNATPIASADSDASWWLNFWYGDYYGYWNSYPSNYYWYTPNYGMWYGGYSYYPYNYYDQGNYSYFTYYW